MYVCVCVYADRKDKRPVLPGLAFSSPKNKFGLFFNWLASNFLDNLSSSLPFLKVYGSNRSMEVKSKICQNRTEHARKQSLAFFSFNHLATLQATAPRSAFGLLTSSFIHKRGDAPVQLCQLSITIKSRAAS